MGNDKSCQKTKTKEFVFKNLSGEYFYHEFFGLILFLQNLNTNKSFHYMKIKKTLISNKYTNQLI